MIGNASSVFGTAPDLSDLSPNDNSVSVSPASRATDLSGSRTCSTTATDNSDAGIYPVSKCGGLSDPGFSVVYDLADSNETVGAADQSLTFPPIAEMTFGADDFTPTAAASSGLPVSFATNGDDSAICPDTCSVTKETASTWDVSMTGGGQCSLTATQAGDDNYLAAPDISESFNIASQTQTITFNPLPDKTFGDAAFTVSATASSSLPITYSASEQCTVDPDSGEVQLTAAGHCLITASQRGDATFGPAEDQSQRFAIERASQDIDFASLPDVQFGSGDITVAATAGSGEVVMFSVSGDCLIHGDTVHVVQVGSCTVTASQSGDSNFTAASEVSRTFDITKGDQQISFAGLTDKTLGASEFTVSATASSGDAVTFTAGNASSCTVTGTTVHLTGAGSCSVVAAQSGDSNYNAAPNITQTFTIHKATPTVTVMTTPSAPTIGPVTYTVSVLGVSGFSPSGAVTVSDGSKHCTTGSLSSDGTSSCHILQAAGSRTITASYAGDSDFTSATGTHSETVKRARPTVSFTTKAPASPHGTTEKLTFTATVTGVTGIKPTGSVTIHDGRGDTCTGNLRSAGTAKCSFSEKKGLRNITAHYNGDSNYTTVAKTKKVVVKG